MKAEVRSTSTFQAQMDHIKSSHQVYSNYPHLIHLFSQCSVTFCKVIQKAIKAKSLTQYASCLSRLHALSFLRAAMRKYLLSHHPLKLELLQSLRVQDSLLTSCIPIPLHLCLKNNINGVTVNVHIIQETEIPHMTCQKLGPSSILHHMKVRVMSS